MNSVCRYLAGVGIGLGLKSGQIYLKVGARAFLDRLLRDAQLRSKRYASMKNPRKTEQRHLRGGLGASLYVQVHFDIAAFGYPNLRGCFGRLVSSLLHRHQKIGLL